jgi:hypothetical protein
MKRLLMPDDDDYRRLSDVIAEGLEHSLRDGDITHLMACQRQTREAFGNVQSLCREALEALRTGYADTESVRCFALYLLTEIVIRKEIARRTTTPS